MPGRGKRYPGDMPGRAGDGSSASAGAGAGAGVGDMASECFKRLFQADVSSGCFNGRCGAGDVMGDGVKRAFE